jgi:sugar phosphate isomerase/epimerase
MTAVPWPLAAYLPSLPLDFAAALRRAAGLGFSHVDVIACADRPGSDLEALAEAGVVVSCAALGRGLPAGHTLDAGDPGVRRATLDALQRQVADAARLGATCAYLVPGLDAGAAGLTYFGEGCALLADHAGRRMVRLCVEHFPGRALADAAGTLDWLARVGHPNLGLLLDVGHCLITGEDPAAVVRRAGDRLAYVQLDDNDGAGDLHWPLLTGRLTEHHLEDLAAALRAVGYRGGMDLELNPGTADPVAALREGKEIVERFFAGGRSQCGGR